MTPRQRCFQRILWRENPTDELLTYELNTVTYGTASAPYLAVKCLHYLADENITQYPTEARIIKREIYVDDLLTGADTIEELQSICNNIYNIFKGAGLNLRKWSSNTRDFEGINIRLENSITEINHGLEFKTLGISYDSNNDVFTYSLSEIISPSTNITKRHILSNAARIFDPSPLTVIPKLLIQQTWKEKLDWDQEVSQSIQSDWCKFIESTKALTSLIIPRYVFARNAQKYNLHGFGDASERAYGACVYVQAIDQNGAYNSYLCTAKSKIAPIKTVTLPRLELCAAVLLARLVNRVLEIFTHQFEHIYYWTDSRITLAWIQSCPSRWRTFVLNRVAEIQRISDQNRWFHVQSNNNPADLITRGTTLQELVDNKLWWNGPQDIINLAQPVQPYNADEVPEQKITTLITNSNLDVTIFSRFSDLNKLINVVAYCLRFTSNCKNVIKTEGDLTISERTKALTTLIKLSQVQSFPSELNKLRNNQQLESTSNILVLNPFLDNDGLIRVGGRLSNASIGYNKMHQILLPKNHKLTDLIAKSEHIKNFHCGS